MKKIITLLLALIMVLSLCACGSKAKEVDSLITAIGTVSADSGEAIKSAADAYNALEEKDKEKVENCQLLTDAQAVYKIYEQIDSFGEVTSESGDAVLGLRNAYDALTAEQQSMIDESFVVAIEDAYEEAVFASYKSLEETVSTDLLEFTLIDSERCYYANNTSGNDFGKPTDTENTFFVAPSGNMIVVLTCSLKNNGRTTYDFTPGCFFSIATETNESSISKNSYMNGAIGSSLSNLDDWKTSNDLISSGETIYFRFVGTAYFDELEGAYTISLSLPSINDGAVNFTYYIAE